MDMSVLGTESDPIWVIDPVDGTHNFAHGKPIFATIVALVNAGEVVQSWIYDIPNDRFAIAEQGSGVELSGQRVPYQKMTEELNETRGFISRKFLANTQIILYVLFVGYAFNVVIVCITAMKLKRNDFNILNTPIRFL
jgi:fructose-1,6-bisphosphatase/inositol monophosphatase family enzyme